MAGVAGAGGLVKRGPLDLARLVGLENVAFLDVVEVVEQDAALEALGDLSCVLLEALELRDRRVVDHGSVAHDAHLRAPPHDARCDHAAGDRAEPRDLEEGAHLGLADDLLGLDGGEHADERLLDVLGELVDDAVGADVDALALRELPCLGVRTHVEADDECVRSRGEHDVALGDRADALVDHVHAHLGVLDLRELGDRRLNRAADVALEDQVQILDGAFLQLREQRLERDAARLRALRELLGAEPLATALRELACLTLVLDDACELAGAAAARRTRGSRSACRDALP